MLYWAEGSRSRNAVIFASVRNVPDRRPRTEIAQTIYGSIQELAGFDRPERLDM